MTGITAVEATLVAFALVTAIATAAFRDVLASIIVFAAYSLGMALLYTYLLAPDVAMTEAAIGAGVTTLLLLLTIARTTRPSYEDAFESIHWPGLIVVGAFALVFAQTLWAFDPVGAAEAAVVANAEVTGYYIENAYHDTHVQNTVAAVLASYRGFDTFGEAIVVFAAGVALLLVLQREAFTQ